MEQIRTDTGSSRYLKQVTQSVKIGCRKYIWANLRVRVAFVAVAILVCIIQGIRRREMSPYCHVKFVSW